jgi:glycosyltransferase involved in cell wall biosynthesis
VKHPTRLLLLNQFYAPDISPTAQLAASLAEHRASLGDEVTIVTGRAGYAAREVTDHETPSAVRVIRLPMPGLGRDRTLGRLVDYLVFAALASIRVALMPRQDVVVSMTTPPFIVVAGVIHKLLHPGSRLVLWSMDCYPDAAERFGTIRPGSRVSRVLRALQQWVFRRLDHVVALDDAMAALLTSQYAPVTGGPGVAVIPNWERAELFPDVPPEASWAGYEDPELRERFVVLYLGNAGIGHQFDTVLEAARRLTEDVVFLFIGGGIKFSDLAAARSRGVTNVVLRRYVPKPETRAVMAGAGAALIVLDDAALGVMSPSKLHGYLAARLPVVYVGPEGSNVDDALARYECGARVRHGDVDGLIAAVQALRDEAWRNELGERGRKAFDDAYCDIRALPRFDEILRASGPRAPGVP